MATLSTGSAESVVVSHSKCRALVRVDGLAVTAIFGDANNLECRGYLRLRSEHFHDVLCAPDHLKAPLRRAGPQGAPC